MCFFLYTWTCIYNIIGHRCNIKGCGTILVLDGNQKNNHIVCAAEEAGYVEYHGQEGCMNTPLQASTFCALHKPREMKIESKNSICAQNRGIQHRVIKSILQEKQTRSGKHDQVSNSYYHPGGSINIIVENFGKVFKLPRSPRSPPHTPLCMRP
jgi:hypothetical protein